MHTATGLNVISIANRVILTDIFALKCIQPSIGREKRFLDSIIDPFIVIIVG